MLCGHVYGDPLLDAESPRLSRTAKLSESGRGTWPTGHEALIYGISKGVKARKSTPLSLHGGRYG